MDRQIDTLIDIYIDRKLDRKIYRYIDYLQINYDNFSFIISYLVYKWEVNR